MATKCTWLWNGQARNGALFFGFSETWYHDLPPSALISMMINAAKLRVPILASGTVLYGFRLGVVGEKSFTTRISEVIKAPLANSTPNVPQDAALCSVFGNAAPSPRKLFWLHNLPDDVVADAKFQTYPAVAIPAQNFTAHLAANGFKFRYQVLGAPSRINGITAGGVVTLADPLVGVVPGSNVKLSRVRDVNGRGVRGIYRVAPDPAPTTTTFTLLGWGGKVVGASGKLSLITYAYAPVLAGNEKEGKVDSVLQVPGVRKCGRPFGQLRGRVSARR